MKRIICSWQDIEARLPINGEKIYIGTARGYKFLFYRTYIGKANGISKFSTKVICKRYLYNYLQAHKDVVLTDEDEIDHINHDRSDDRLENLRAVSHADNNQNDPLWVHNRNASLRKSLASLTDEQVKQIKRLISEGHSLTSIAKQFNRNKQTIWQIKKGLIYKDL